MLALEAPALRIYLLGSVDFEAALALQRRLVYDVAGHRESAVLLLCEHPPLITVGRQGSRSFFHCDDEELRAQQWRVRWVNRGGGCLLHLPGQLAIYPILALDRIGLDLPGYLDRLRSVLAATLDDFAIRCQPGDRRAEMNVARRPIAVIGAAVRDWVTYYGAALNINPDLAPFRLVRCGDRYQEPMTSLERERHGPLRPALVRERLIEHFAAQFQCDRVSLFFDHPQLPVRPRRLERALQRD
jgi:lipoyl(octanoyl) transferase